MLVLLSRAFASYFLCAAAAAELPLQLAGLVLLSGAFAARLLCAAAAAELSLQLPVLAFYSFGSVIDVRRPSWLQVAQLCPRIHVLEDLQPLLLRFAEVGMCSAHHRTHLHTQWQLAQFAQ